MNVSTYDFVRIVRLLLSLIRLVANGASGWRWRSEKMEDEISSELSKIAVKGLDQLGKKS